MGLFENEKKCGYKAAIKNAIKFIT